MAKAKRNANKPLMYTGLAIYGGLLLLFGWQTWMFLNWLFPDDQLGAKILTLISFDVLALFWSLVHTFYSFKSHGALWWVRIAWGLTFVLSLVASVLYLAIQFFFRFHLTVDPIAVNIGYSVSLVALVFNIIALMAWLILEYIARHPRQHEFEQDDEREDETSHPLSPHSPLAQSVGRSNNNLYHAWRDASIEERQAIMNTYLGHSTPVPSLSNPDKYLDLLDKAERYGQISKEEAEPLRDMIRGSVTRPLPAAPKNGAHPNQEQS